MQEFSIVHGCLKHYAGDEETAVIPSGITEIAYRAFYGNKTLKKVILSEGLVKIDFQAFLDCTALTEIVFPDSLTSVSRESFKNTAWLANCSESAVYAGPILLFVKDNPAEVIVREGTKIIASDAFRNCTDLKTVSLPPTVEIIEHRAFQGCSALKKLCIPAAVKSLGDRVFLDCKNIEITLESARLAIGRKCFPNEAIIHVREITPQELSANVQMRAVAAFADDMAQDHNLLKLMLEWEVIPADEADIILEEILNSGDGEIVAALLRYKEHNQAESAFDEGDSDLSLDWEIAEEKSEDELKKDWGFKENLDGTLSILRYYGSEEKVEVPSKIGERAVNDIAAEAFSPKRYGLGLKSIAKLKNIRQITIADGITQIGRYAFAYCENLEEVTLAESVIEIGDYAFLDCKKLKKVNMPQMIEQIGTNAFAGCDEVVL